jgi:glycosyltransferase involved in cell wall biosynthesis
LNKDYEKISFLLIVPYTIPQYSGSGLNAFNFARFLSREGIKVTLLSFNRNMKSLRKEWIENVYIRRILYFNKNLLLKILSLVIIIPLYGLYILSNDIILIYGGHVIGYEIIILLGKLLKKKIIFQSLLYSTDDIETIIKNKPKFLSEIYIKLFSQVDIYHSINSDFSDKFRKILNKSNSLLEMPQGVDIKIFKSVSDEMRLSARNQLCIPEKSYVLLSVGFMIQRKGFSGVFDSLKNLDIQFIYIIAGEFDFPNGHFLYQYSNSASELVEKGKRLLGDKLILAGPVRDIQKYYSAADVVLFNSFQEGLPNSLLEAMSCGIPVVIRNIPGLEGFILKDEKNCLIFNDENEMKNHIQYLYDNKDIGKKLVSTAMREIQQNATFQVVLSNYFKRLFLTEVESK